jgi:hypothetical protein
LLFYQFTPNQDKPKIRSTKFLTSKRFIPNFSSLRFICFVHLNFCHINRAGGLYKIVSGPTWNRTRDLPVMSRWLCQLSYGPLKLSFTIRSKLRQRSRICNRMFENKQYKDRITTFRICFCQVLRLFNKTFQLPASRGMP